MPLILWWLTPKGWAQPLSKSRTWVAWNQSWVIWPGRASCVVGKLGRGGEWERIARKRKKGRGKGGGVTLNSQAPRWPARETSVGRPPRNWACAMAGGSIRSAAAEMPSRVDQPGTLRRFIGILASGG